MLTMIGKRLLFAIPSLIGVVIVTFLLTRALPGDPAAYFAGPAATKEAVEQIRKKLGLDKPLIEQFFRYTNDLAHGDFGNSLTTGQPVATEIRNRLPASAELTLLGLVVSVMIAIPLGVLAATRVGSRVDTFVTSIASLGVALPSFWLAILLVANFSLIFHWFPATGARPITVDPRLAILHATLPAVALAVGVIAELARQVRSALIEVLSSQYYRTLRAKGLSPIAMLWKHGLRNVSVTMLTILGLQVNRLFSGAVVIEAVFAVPGAGQLVAYSAINKDFPVVQGVVLVLVVIVILINLTVDVLSALLDPRAAQA